MKKIVAFAVGLLVINSSSIMGMMGRGPQENRVLQRTTETHRPLTKKAKKRQIEREQTIQWRTRQNIEAETTVLAVGKDVACTFSMIPLTLLQSPELRHSKESVCFDSTILIALWAVYALTIGGSVYEFNTQKPFLGSRSKNMLLSAGEFAASAAPMICSAMVNDCPKIAPNCTILKEYHSLASLLAAGYCLYQASLNK